MRNLLIVVDMQYDFINGSLGSKEAEGIVEDVINEVKFGPYNEIYFTRDTHESNYLQTLEGQYLPIEHCIKGSEGWYLHDKMVEAAMYRKEQGEINDIKIINKPTFGSKELLEAIKSGGDVDSITIVGLVSDICVISNALMLKAEFYDIPIHVIENCCAGSSPEMHKAAMDVMRSCQIEVM